MTSSLKITIITAFIFLCGCVNIEGLYNDPSFNYQSIYQNNIGVGGVASAVRPLPLSKQTAYAEFLHSSLTKKYPNKNVMPAGDTIRALGSSTYKRMINKFRITGVINDNYLSMLHQNIHHLRYLAFARILQQSVSHDINTTTNYEYNTETKKQEETGTTDQYRTTLTVRVKLMVYDLQTKKIVWSGINESQEYNGRDYDGDSSSNSGKFVKDVVTGLAKDLIHDAVFGEKKYPAPPGVTPIIKNIFNNFMEKFPTNKS